MSGLKDNKPGGPQTDPMLLYQIQTVVGTAPTNSGSPNVDFTNLIKDQMRVSNPLVSQDRMAYSMIGQVDPTARVCNKTRGSVCTEKHMLARYS